MMSGIIQIKYTVADNSYKITSNLTKEGVDEIISAFISSQIGAGKDKSEPNDYPTFNIRLEWTAAHDDIHVVYDTGNKSLREGILMDVLWKLRRNEIQITQG